MGAEMGQDLPRSGSVSVRIFLCTRGFAAALHLTWKN